MRSVVRPSGSDPAARPGVGMNTFSSPDPRAARAGGPVRRAAVAGLGAYKRWVSPLLPPRCRFWPTCSEYARLAIARHGLGRGGLLAARRLLRCHPFHPGGIDPPPG